MIKNEDYIDFFRDACGTAFPGRRMRASLQASQEIHTNKWGVWMSLLDEDKPLGAVTYFFLPEDCTAAATDTAAFREWMHQQIGAAVGRIKKLMPRKPAKRLNGEKR